MPWQINTEADNRLQNTKLKAEINNNEELDYKIKTDDEISKMSQNDFDNEIKQYQSSQHTTREAYQQMKKYKNVEPIPKVRKDLDDFNYLYKQKENKIYDINSVLEEARKNREDNDNKEAKRKLETAINNENLGNKNNIQPTVPKKKMKVKKIEFKCKLEWLSKN